MAATITDIADAVVAALNVANRFGLPVEAERSYVPLHELRDLAELKVSVVGRGYTSARSDRGSWLREYRVDVGFQQRVGDAAADEIDPLVELVEQVANWFEDNANKRPLSDMPRLVVAAVDVDPAFDPAHVDEHRTFTSLLTLTFREWR